MSQKEKMREILFRGKFGSEWKFGYLSVEPKGPVIKEPYVEGNSNIWHIAPETIGQYTGLTDKNGKKIFEGDVCAFIDFHGGSDNETYCEGVFKFSDGSFYVTNRLSADMDDLIENGVFDGYIIGNIYDKPGTTKGA